MIHLDIAYKHRKLTLAIHAVDSELSNYLHAQLARDVKVPQKPLYYIPFSRNAHFVGRRDQLDALKEKLFIDSHCQNIAIVGLGGVGKTQIALELAYQVKETHANCSVFWVPAISHESFEQAFLDMAHLLRIPRLADEKVDTKEVVKNHLSQEEAGQWLFILDNADSYDILFGSNTQQMSALTSTEH